MIKSLYHQFLVRGAQDPNKNFQKIWLIWRQNAAAGSGGHWGRNLLKICWFQVISYNLPLNCSCFSEFRCWFFKLKNILVSVTFQGWKLETSWNKKALKLLRRISPVAWQHIHFQGHFTFSKENVIDLDEIIQQLTIGD